MASIIIASKANSRPLAECEVLAEFLAKNQPQFNYSVIKKHKNEWDDFLTSLTESYGFKRKCCPIVFTVEGELIGDTREFYDYCQNKYGKIVRVGNEVSEPRAKANAQEAKEFVRKRDKGANLIEKIQKTLRKAKVKKLVSNLEGNFEKIIHNGIPYKVRLTDMSKRSVEFTEEVLEPEPEVPEEAEEDKEGEAEEEPAEDNLDYDDLESKEENKEEPTPNEGEGSQAQDEGEGGNSPEGEGDAAEEPQPVEETKEEKKEKVEPIVEEPVSVDDVMSQYPFDPAKGMTFEDFEKFYKDEIEGKLNRREAVKERDQRKNGELEEEKEPEEDHQEETQQEMDQDPDGEGEGQEGEGDLEAKERREAEKERLEKEREEEERKRQEEERIKKIEEANKMRDEFYNEYVQRRYNIDDKYQREILKKLKIETFDDNYALYVHPEPPMQEVMMIFQSDPDLEDDDLQNYRDFGLVERLPLTKVPEEMENFVKTEEAKVSVSRSPLKSTEIDITNPLTSFEWKLWYHIITSTKGYGFLQILPVGYRSSAAFSANLLHVAPKTKSWGEFESPLNKLISLRKEFYIKENTRLFEEKQKKDKDVGSKSAMSQVDKEHQEELKRQEEIKNEHIYKFSKDNIFKLPEFDFPHYVCILESEPSDSSLMTDYLKICDELELGDLQSLGATVIMTQEWMFVAALSQPYMKIENDLDLFIDPFSYAGILNIHVKAHSWPQTAGIDVKDKITSYLPSKAYSEPLPSQLPEEEPPVEEEDEYDDQEAEGEGKEGEGEGDAEKEDKEGS